MRSAVHHLRRRSIKRAAELEAIEACRAVPRLRSSMMAGAFSTPARTKLAKIYRVPESTRTPGPMVDESVTRFKYMPLEEAGFAFCRSAISA